MAQKQTSAGGLSSAKLLVQREQEVLQAWMEAQLASITLRPDLLSETALRQESRDFLDVFARAIVSKDMQDLNAPAFEPLLQMLGNLSRSRAVLDFSPSETATFIFSLKDTILAFLQADLADQPAALNREVGVINQLLDKLGLYTFETFAQSREEIVNAQTQTILELSSPVLRLWDEVVLMPLVGIVDTERAQLMLDALLNAIAEIEAQVAIIDVTGVPVIDTQVAGHLLTAAQGAHMLGAETIITGVSVEVAKTLTKLHVRLQEVVTRSSLRAGLRYAFKLLGVQIVREEEE